MPVVNQQGTSVSFNTKHSSLPFLTRLFGDHFYTEDIINGVKVTLPLAIDVVKILHNAGVNTEGLHPIHHRYTYPKVKLTHEMYPHAKATSNAMVEFERGFVLNESRLGKSSSFIAAADYLMKDNVVKSVLIIAPLSTLQSVWQDEINGMVPQRSTCLLANNKTGKARKKFARDELKKGHSFYIINPDGIKVLERELQDAINNKLITAVVVDESTEFGNYRTARWKVLNRLVKHLRYLWLMTATPGSPEFVYGQAKLINPSSVPTSVDVWKMKTMIKVSKYKWIPKPTSDKMIQQVLVPSIRFRKRDVFKDMPDEMIIPRRIELSPKQASMLDIMNEDGGMILNGVEVVPANAAVLLDKVLQISSGTMIIDSKAKQSVRLPIDDKVNAVLDLMKETPFKTIIITNYRETCSYLCDEFNGKGVNTAMVNGSVSAKDRAVIFRDFMADDELRCLVAHPETVQYGLELASADKLIFWGAPKISPFKYKQTKDRIYSGYQKSEKPAVYQFYSTFVEKRMFDALEKGDEWQTKVADFFNSVVDGEI